MRVFQLKMYRVNGNLYKDKMMTYKSWLEKNESFTQHTPDICLENFIMRFQHVFDYVSTVKCFLRGFDLHVF